MTKKELEAENERLGKEIAALRVLLAAVHDAADVPMPVHDADLHTHYMTCVRRADVIAVYANADDSVNVMHDRAESLREEAARPLRYVAKAAGRAEPAPVITDSERTCDQSNPASGAWCHRPAPHAEHRDTDGETWTTGEGGVLFPAGDEDESAAPVYLLKCGCQLAGGDIPWPAGYGVVCDRHGETTVVMTIPLAAEVTA